MGNFNGLESKESKAISTRLNNLLFRVVSNNYN